MIALPVSLVFLLLPAIPQDPAYHEFSDTRHILGIPNFWNVASNLPFLMIGAAGLLHLSRHAEQLRATGLATAYAVFFAGVLLTAFGSSWYHLAPANITLIWDRLPMTIGFGALISIIIGEFVAIRIAQHLLLPLLILGFGSVAYWAWSEAQGAGDLRPYAIVQFLPMLLIPVILFRYRTQQGAAHYYWWMLVCYLLAKLLEYFDGAIFDFGQLISGHSLKHVAAAATAGILLLALQRRC